MNVAPENAGWDELANAGEGQRSAAAWTLLIALQERGIEVRRVGGDLRVSQADMDRIAPVEIERLRHLRQELMALLQPISQEAPGTLTTRDGWFPLSTSQRRMWDIEHIHGYKSPRLIAAVTIRGVIEIDRLEKAFASVVARHSALRIRVEAIAGEPLQSIRESAAFKLDRFDLRGEPLDQSWAKAARIRAEYLDRPLALASGGVFRAAILRVEEGTSCLLICVHHICADGYSMQILRKDLMAFYRAQTEGRGGAHGHLDHVEWEHTRLARDRDRLVAYWSRAVVGAYAWRELQDPTALAEASGASRRELRLGAEELARLKQVARQASATLNATMLAVVASVMDRHAVALRPVKRRGVNIGMPVSGRASSRFEDVIGFFANTLIVSVDSDMVEAGPPALVRHCQQRLGDAMLHQALPYQDIIRAMEHIDGGRPFQVSFNMMARESGNTDLLPGVSVATWEGELQAGFFDLRIDITENQDGMTIQLLHLLNKLSPVYIEKFLAEMKSMVDIMCGGTE